jgi:hypothetical protein
VVKHMWGTRAGLAVAAFFCVAAAPGSHASLQVSATVVHSTPVTRSASVHPTPSRDGALIRVAAGAATVTASSGTIVRRGPDTLLVGPVSEDGPLFVTLKY